jgi:hypothetical protein
MQEAYYFGVRTNCLSVKLAELLQLLDFGLFEFSVKDASVKFENRVVVLGIAGNSIVAVE